MKLLELSSGFFSLIKENGDIFYFRSFEEVEKDFGFEKTFELFLNSDYLNLSNYTPVIFSLGFNNYKICFLSGRTEFITSSDRDFLNKFKDNYKIIEEKVII